MRVLVLLFQYCFLGSISAQPTIQWQTTFGGTSHDIAYSAIQTQDGGYIAAGKSGSSSLFGHHGGNDFWVIKLNADGDLKWKKLLGGTGNEVARCVRQDSDGGYFIAGYTESNNYDVSGNHGGFYDGWFVKLDPNGNIQWQKTLGGSGWDDIISATQTTDNGYILTGRSENADGDVSFNYGFTDVWVVKLSQSGALEWEKSYGGGLEDSGHSIKQTADGGFIVVGQAYSTDGDVTGQHGNGDFWALKISSTGVLEWQKALGGSGYDLASDVAQTADGEYVLVGYSGSNNGDVTGHYSAFDYWVTMLDASGNLRWEKSLGGSEADWGRAIVASEDGGVIAAGSTSSSDGDVQNNDGGAEFWLVKLNGHGQIVWQQTYGGTEPELCYTLSKTSDGGFVTAGYSWSTDGDVTGSSNAGKSDFWIVKLGSESVGVEDLSNNEGDTMELYPNPTGEKITIKVTGFPSSVQITLIDMLGSQVLQQEVSQDATINLAHLKPGIYFATAITPDGKVLRKKFEKF